MHLSSLLSVLLALLSSVLCVANGLGQPPATDAETAQNWGAETLEKIRRDFWAEDQGLYLEYSKGGRREPHPAFMWSAGVQLSALAAAACVNSVHKNHLEQYAEVLKSYWHTHDGVGGYDVQPNGKSSDRYYDDNAWIVLAQMEMFEVTENRQYLDDAIKTFDFVLSGQDEVLDGGIYWRENEKTSKNTCVNAPATVSALRLYQHTQDRKHLETAERLYSWTNARLQDTESGLFFDNVALDGTIDRRKFCYNSALMIRANCLFYQVTGDTSYLASAQRIARAAESHWVDASSGAVRDAACFAHMLLEAFLALYECDGDSHWIEVCTSCVTHLHDALRDEQGNYPGRWDQRRQERRRRGLRLIDQASAARAFFVVAAALSPDGALRSSPTPTP